MPRTFHRKRYRARESAAPRPLPGILGALPPSALAVLREFNPNHDERGRFATGDGGGSGAATRSVPFAPSRSTHGWPTGQEQAQYEAAVQDAVARSPELASGKYPLLGVGYNSGPPPPGVSASDWENTRAHQIEADTMATTSRRSTDGSFIMINDQGPFETATEAAASTQTRYGAMEHEVGHAYWMANGVTTNGGAAQTLGAAGIGPNDLKSIGSLYGASSPMEALGELYGMAHTPGYGLSGDLGRKYSALEEAVPYAKGLPPRNSIADAWIDNLLYSTLGLGVPRPGGPAALRMLAAAYKNLAANAWVADGGDII